MVFCQVYKNGFQVTLLLIQKTEASGKITMTILEWSGSVCCKEITDCPKDCEYDFEFCIGMGLPGQCAFSQLLFKTPHQIPQRYGLRVLSNRAMTVTASVDKIMPNTKSVVFHLKATVAGKESFVVAFVERPIKLKAGKSIEINEVQPTFRLIADLEFTCDPGYFGDDCTSFCQLPEKDDHYVCSEKGKVCLEGWTGPDCDEPICRESCNHGRCVAPDTCECPSGWLGSNCDVCMPSDSCVNGYCSDTPFTCICQENYGGENCDKVVDICRESPGLCLNGGNCTSSSFDRYSCSCPSGYSGKNCEIFIGTVYKDDKEAVNSERRTLTENPYFWIFAIVAIVVLGSVLGVWITSRRKTGINSQFRAGRRPSDIEMDSLGPGRRKISESEEKPKNSPPPPYSEEPCSIQELCPVVLPEPLEGVTVIRTIRPPNYKEAMEGSKYYDNQSTGKG
ncbi:hypothetical protein FO519_008258 [Halicephalobus sp. NKZ332]|nr:hypothetical protein FO519_008258 [Halicephalobus sp. NKZ332]